LSLTPEKLRERFEKAGLLSFFPLGSIPLLIQFTNRMLQINETINLTKWTEDEEVLAYHLLDSAYVLPELWQLIQNSQRWIDLGTGCGFPGAVLIAAFPQVQVTLMDSVAKKTKALGDCLQVSGLKAETLTGRAEDFGRDPQTRESWDGVVVRAVADFPIVLEYAIPLLKTGGYLVNWITKDQLKTLDKSEKALQALQCKIIKKVEYSLPGLQQSRYFVMVEKLGKTPITYPRAVGQASKHPL
jgi:16S rRNA (guanine527-N7)-methyltransferase